MQKAELNYSALNTFLMNYELPGGIKPSDFQRYYITEASKVFMGLVSDFNKGEYANPKTYQKVYPILKHFDLLIDEDKFYNISKKFTRIRTEIGDEALENDKYMIEALEKLSEVSELLDKAYKNQKNTSNHTDSAKYHEEKIQKFIYESGLTLGEVLEKLKN